MNRPLLLALAAVSLTRAEAALAGSSCQGGGSSSGGSSSGGSSSSGSSSSSSSDGGSSSSSTPACADETDIVGYRRCTPFGAWSPRRLPLIIIELGTSVRSFASPLREASGELTHEQESFTYRVVGRPAGMASPPAETAVVSTVRLGVGMPRGFYVALDAEIGGLARSTGRAEMTSTGTFGAPSLTPGSSLVVGALAVAGVRGETRRGSLGVEVAGGSRSITYNYESRYLACTATTSHRVSSPLLEARARASLWLTPFLNLGATAGASVIERGAWMAGVHLGVVSQAYGNLRD